MKNKKSFFALFGTIVVGLSIFAFMNRSESTFKDVNADDTHVGYHYQAKAATETESGWQEYWTCCECHESFLTQPDGTFEDQSEDNMLGGAPSEGHVAYIPALAMFNTYTSVYSSELVDIGGSNDVIDFDYNKAITFYTTTTTGITFTLVDKDGNRLTSKFCITIGDGSNITVTDVYPGGWNIYPVGNDVYYVSIRMGSLLFDGRFAENAAYYVNFRDVFPITIGNLKVREYESEGPRIYHWNTYSSNTTMYLYLWGSPNIQNLPTSDKAVTFFTTTTTGFTFVLQNGGTRLTAKIVITIGDGSNPTVTDVKDAGWEITEVESGVYYVNIRIGSISYAQSDKTLEADYIQFRDNLPAVIADLRIKDYDAIPVARTFTTYSSSSTAIFSELGYAPIVDTANSDKRIVFYTTTTTAFTFCLVASTGDRITSKNMIITIGDGTNPTVADVASGGWSITSVGGGVYLVSIRAGSITSNGSFGNLDANGINYRDRLPVTIANFAII